MFRESADLQPWRKDLCQRIEYLSKFRYILQCGASGRKGRGRGDITFSLEVSSTAAVDIFWRFDLTMFTSSESAADWIFTINGPAMCSITAA